MKCNKLVLISILEEMVNKLPHPFLPHSSYTLYQVIVYSIAFLRSVFYLFMVSDAYLSINRLSHLKALSY